MVRPPTTRRRSVRRLRGPAGSARRDRIEVGVLIVGAGPAGLACAIRLGQLLEEHPEVAEQLGDVPIAVVEKGKQAGSHLLSGAVVNPRSLQPLFGGRLEIDRLPQLRAGARRGGVRAHPPVRPADPDPATHAQPRQPDRLALPAGTLAGPAGRRRRHHGPARNGRREAAGCRWPGGGGAHGGQGSRANW